MLRIELNAPAHIKISNETAGNLDELAATLRASIDGIPTDFKRLRTLLGEVFGDKEDVAAILRDALAMASFARDLSLHISATRLRAIKSDVQRVADNFNASDCELAAEARKILAEDLGSSGIDVRQLHQDWNRVLAELSHLRSLQPALELIRDSCEAIFNAGAPAWADRLRSQIASGGADPAVPPDWKEAWDWAARLGYLEKIAAVEELERLHAERLRVEHELRSAFASLVKERTFYTLAESMKGTAKAALQQFSNIVGKMGQGGKRAVLHRQNAREAMERCYDAVPCWIMPAWRVSEQLPSAIGSFDLVILDEASQSDAREIPALLRGKKVLVVGDDQQVSPSAAFLSIANIERLRNNFLRDFPFGSEVEPGASIYDLARVMFPAKFVMLKEHFRCVEPIIRFSMQFYSQNLVPLRVPKSSERLEPPLIDILVEDGARRGKSKINPREAEVIVDEIEKLIYDFGISVIPGEERPRSIGIISLIGAEQAAYIQRLLMERIGEAAMLRHRIVCGDSATLQGNERDIVFLSMVADRDRKQAQTARQYQQRFNVALSRARDRMVLVRSVKEKELNPR